MEDAGGGEGVSAERFAALMSHAKLPEPLAADAHELLQALTPCVAAYDASEEAQQPLVRAAAARRSSGFGARDALPALTRRVPLGAPRRARVARARTDTRHVVNAVGAHAVRAGAVLCQGELPGWRAHTVAVGFEQHHRRIVRARGGARACDAQAVAAARRAAVGGPHWRICKRITASECLQATHAASRRTQPLVACATCRVPRGVASRPMRPALQRPGPCAARCDADNSLAV